MSENVDRGIALVRVLAAVLSHLVASNDAAPSAAEVTKFHALRPPSITIADYLERIRKYASCSAECFVLALVYIDRLIQQNNITLTSLNVHRVLITSVMLAAKFFDDQYFNNAYYARVGGIPTSEINSLELEFLFSINFSLHVAGEEFNQYFSELVNYAPTMVTGPDAESVHEILQAAPRAEEPSPLPAGYGSGYVDSGAPSRPAEEDMMADDSAWGAPGEGDMAVGGGRGRERVDQRGMDGADAFAGWGREAIAAGFAPGGPG